MGEQDAQYPRRSPQSVVEHDEEQGVVVVGRVLFAEELRAVVEELLEDLDLDGSTQIGGGVATGDGVQPERRAAATAGHDHVIGQLAEIGHQNPLATQVDVSKKRAVKSSASMALKALQV